MSLPHLTQDTTTEEREEISRLRGDAEGTAELIRLEGGEAAAFYGDVSDFETARKMVQFALDAYGRLDILVNNAAGLGKGSVEDSRRKTGST